MTKFKQHGLEVGQFIVALHPEVYDLRNEVLFAPLGIENHPEYDEVLDAELLSTGVRHIGAWQEGADEHSSKLVAAARLVQKISNSWSIQRFVVAERVQGLGVGSAMLDELVQVALRQSVEPVEITLNARNSSIDFYRKNGFTETGERVTYTYEGVSGSKVFVETSAMKRIVESV